MFAKRSTQLERIDTGDYTPEEYDRFLKEIRFINRYVGDNRALRRSLLKEIDPASRSVLDVGAGSGELLRTIEAETSLRSEKLDLVGLDLNERSNLSLVEESIGYPNIHPVRGDALSLPFEDGSFDYVISSLFTHHLTDDQIVNSLKEMSRVALREFYVIDLHRHPVSYRLYRAMCFTLGISELVTHDGSLSILKGFLPGELIEYASAAGIERAVVMRSFPFRLVLSGKGKGS